MTNWLNSTSEKHLEKFLSWKHLVINTTFFMNFQKLEKHYHSVASLPDWHTVDLGSIPNSGMKKKRPPGAYRGLCFWYVLLVSTQKVKRCVFAKKKFENFLKSKSSFFDHVWPCLTINNSKNKYFFVHVVHIKVDQKHILYLNKTILILISILNIKIFVCKLGFVIDWFSVSKCSLAASCA